MRQIKTILLFLLISILLSSCNFQKNKLPNLNLAIQFERYISGYDDLLYELREDGTLSVTLCKLKQNNSLEFDTMYNTSGELVLCRFQTKKYQLTRKQQRILLEYYEELIAEKSIHRRVNSIESNTNDATVFIQIDDQVPYSCTYTKNYAAEPANYLYSSAILDIAYRFIDFAPIEPRSEWLIGDKPGKPGTGGKYKIIGMVTHTHKWK